MAKIYDKTGHAGLEDEAGTSRASASLSKQQTTTFTVSWPRLHFYASQSLIETTRVELVKTTSQ